MRPQTAKFVSRAEGAYSALLGLSYIEKLNNESLAKASGEEKFDYAFYTTKEGALYWENHTNFLKLSGKIINGLAPEEREKLFGIIQTKQDSIVINDGSEEGYSVSRNLLNVMNPYMTENTGISTIDSTMVSIASLVGMGLEAGKKIEDAQYNQEYVPADISREVVTTSEIVNDENSAYIRGFAKSIVEDDKKIFPEANNLSGLSDIILKAQIMEDCQ